MRHTLDCRPGLEPGTIPSSPVFANGPRLKARVIGARSADTITARGRRLPHREAGHMTAPENAARYITRKPCTEAAVHT